MELPQEIIEASKLTPEQVTAVKTFGENYVANIKKEYDDKANTNAEGILGGAVKYLQTKTGIVEDRKQGEKYADYLARISDKFLENNKQTLEQARQDYEAKLKDFKGGDALKSDLDKVKAEYDAILKKTADYEDIKKKAEQADELSTKYGQLKIGTAFRDIKPVFPETVNEYEAKAKWADFERSVLAKYDVEIVEDKPIAIDKENKYKQIPLADLVKEDKAITELLAGRQQPGSGAKPAGSTSTIEGVPFPVPEKCDSVERAKLIKEQLTKEGLNPASDEYAKRFGDLNNKILKGGK